MESAENKGTGFGMSPPRSEGAEDASRSQVFKAVRGTGHILVVDDEEVICKLAKRALTILGYEVTTAADGLEAVKIFHEKRGEINLVLLDIVMPKMDGPMAFARMRELDASVPILLCSGFSCTDELADLLQNGAAGFVGKPYRIDELSKEISRILVPPRTGPDTRQSALSCHQ